MLISYILCVVFTYTNVFPNDPEHSLYLVRTDIRTKVISDAKWFRMPYPGQWGVPTVTLAGAIGMMSGIISLIVESIGDYHACARYVVISPCHSSSSWIRPDSNFIMLHADMSMLKNYTVSGELDTPSCTEVKDCPDADTKEIVGYFITIAL